MEPEKEKYYSNQFDSGSLWEPEKEKADDYYSNHSGSGSLWEPEKEKADDHNSNQSGSRSLWEPEKEKAETSSSSQTRQSVSKCPKSCSSSIVFDVEFPALCLPKRKINH